MIKQNGNTVIVLLSKLFIIFIYLCIGGGVWLFIAFVLNGGAAGSSALNPATKVFSVVFAVIFIPTFYIAVRKLFVGSDLKRCIPIFYIAVRKLFVDSRLKLWLLWSMIFKQY